MAPIVERASKSSFLAASPPSLLSWWSATVEARSPKRVRMSAVFSSSALCHLEIIKIIMLVPRRLAYQRYTVRKPLSSFQKQWRTARQPFDLHSNHLPNSCKKAFSLFFQLTVIPLPSCFRSNCSTTPTRTFSPVFYEMPHCEWALA